MSLILRYAAKSDVGLVRAENEDSGYAGSRMLVVADGMGGHAAGELASAAAVATFAELDLDEGIQPGDDEVLGLLAGAIDTAHDVIGRVAANSPESRGMGTTLTALAWLNTRVALAHIGDSRAYLMRDGKLSQLTRDHTFVQTLVDAGRITPEEATTHERRNLLMKALDGVNDVESDLSIREVYPGDRFLLCSDGLCGVVPEPTLAALLGSDSDPTGVVDALVEQALLAGAPDNVTALVADVVDVTETDPGVHRSPIVVGAASERRNRDRLPGLLFPADAEPEQERTPTGSPTPPVMAPPVQPAAAGPPPPRRRRRVRGYTVLGVLAVILLVLGSLGAWAWTRTQYYVGVYQGSVAVFQGIPSGFGPHGWSTVENVSTTQAADLPEYDRAQVEANIPASDVASALAIQSRLAEAAAACKARPTPVGCPSQPGVAPTPRPSPTSTRTTQTPNPALSAARA
ncbi:MAG: Serine/threonine-protein phosphatase [Actinomycetota bacterium]|nr:Serine/threonine-protein phosphatase [Actinomycetota bacterium]